jgi:hypothetical protein
MPVVFVHGVNVRRGESDEERREFERRATLLGHHFRESSLGERVTASDGLRVFMPYWGDLGASFKRNLASIPHDGIQALAVGAKDFANLLETVGAALDGTDVIHDDPNPLLRLATTRSLEAAVNLLIAGTATAPVPEILMTQEEVTAILPDAALFARAAQEYAVENPRPDWLADVQDDEAFVDQLVAHVASGSTAGAMQDARVQTLSVGGSLRHLFLNTVDKVRTAATRIASGIAGPLTGEVVDQTRRGYMLLSRRLRPTASAFIGRFFGDVFTYMDNREPIKNRVLADIDAALAVKRAGDDELLLVGHSFGGIILYDVLTSFRPDLHCDLLVTVGSQVGLFAEMGRLADKANIETAFGVSETSTVPCPRNVARWINIFDPTDLVGFGTQGVFSGVDDYSFETDAFPLLSHTAYFETPRFHTRLRGRAREAFANGTGRVPGSK